MTLCFLTLCALVGSEKVFNTDRLLFLHSVTTPTTVRWDTPVVLYRIIIWVKYKHSFVMFILLRGFYITCLKNYTFRPVYRSSSKSERSSCWDKLCKNPLSNINITSRVWLYCTHIMILYNTTELSHLKKITIQLKIPMNIGLLKRSFRVAASWRLKKMLTVRLEMRCRMLHVWTVVALLAGKFKMSHELFHVHSIFTVSMPGRHWLPWPM